MKTPTLAALLIAGCLPLGAQPAQIAAGYRTSFLIRPDGALWSWGNNAYGMLGRGVQLDGPVPERVGTNQWSSVAAGNQHALAIQGDGTLWAWGNNGRGQLGIGSSGPGAEQSQPVLLSSETNWSAVAGGPDCSFALRRDGTLWAWGWNAIGIFGNGSTRDSNRPLQIGTDSDWSALAVAGHVLALKRDGSLWAWGDNVVGQLGDGTTSTRTRPKQIGTNQSWKAVAAGSAYSLAVTSHGELWAWGLGQFGQLGTADVKNRLRPTRIGADTNWSSVAAGANGVHSFGFKTDGSLWGWGLNTAGQLGSAPSPNGATNLVPALLPIQQWAAIAANSSFSIGLRTDGSVWTTGDNSGGQLGDGTFDGRPRFAPVVPTLHDDQASTEEGAELTIPLLANDADASGGALTVSGTSQPRHGQLALLPNGQVRYAPDPQYFGGDSFTYTARDALGAVASARVDLQVRPNRALNHPPRPEADLASAEDAAAVEINVLANDADPENDPLRLVTFTQGVSGTVTLAGAAVLRYTPAPGFVGQDSFQYTVADPSGAAATARVEVLVGWAKAKLVAGGYRTMLLRPDGTIWAWGANEHGQLGTGDTNALTVPTQVGSDDDWRDLDGDWEFTVARKKDGSLWSWGANYFGQLGNGRTNDSDVPVQIGNDKDWSSFAVSRWHTVALKTDGSLWSWGMNYHGALGTGIDGPARLPQRVGTNSDWSAVFAGVEFSLAKKKDGSLWGWGYNQIGQLGDGTWTDQPVPVRVSPETNWAAVFPANDFVLARKADGTLWGWGENSFGQLATGIMTLDDRFEPNKVGRPVQIGISADWVNAAGGFNHSLGLRQNETLWSWGTGTFGSLGLPIPGIAVAPAPTQIGSKTDWVALSAGEAHSAALDAAGAVWTWGNNGYGQLGLGTRGKDLYDSAASRKTPTLIPGFGLGGFTVSAVRDGGTVTLAWSSAARGFSLESATNVLGPWQPVASTSALSSTNQPASASIVPGQSAQFFRLHK